MHLLQVSMRRQACTDMGCEAKLHHLHSPLERSAHLQTSPLSQPRQRLPAQPLAVPRMGQQLQLVRRNSLFASRDVAGTLVKIAEASRRCSPPLLFASNYCLLRRRLWQRWRRPLV